MPINLDKPYQWKADVAASVAMYNAWFMNFAPEAFRATRVQTTQTVEAALRATANLTNIQPALLRAHPHVLSTLRMSTCPPLAVDRLIGLASVSAHLVKTMELYGRMPSRMSGTEMDAQLLRIAQIIERMADPDIFVWRKRSQMPTEAEVHRAATIVADRLCGAVANPIIKNAQEKRQLALMKSWLEARGYVQLQGGNSTRMADMRPGTFSFRMNVPVKIGLRKALVNMPIDAVIKPRAARPGELPLLFEAKSAGDFANTNKRRKEEATKMNQLRDTYGANIRFSLFLCGYFDSGYLGYEAAEGIDWVWEHRVDDLAQFGI